MRGGVRLKRSAHRLAVAAARRAPARVRVPALLSVVVTVRDADTELDECLWSLRRQHHAASEFVVVDLGVAASLGDVLEQHRSEDTRIRVVRAPGGLAGGRNHGASVAVGEFLAFLDADDAVTPHGYAMAIEALRSSGSDLAVVAHRPVRRGHSFPVPDRLRALHDRRRLGETLERLPDALANMETGARIFRRRAYDEHDLRFADLPFCDDAHSAAAYLGATAFDVLPHVGLLRRGEADRSDLTRLTPDLAGLGRFRDGIRAAVAVLPPALAAVYAAETLAGPLGPFVDRAWRCPDGYWAALRDVVSGLRAVAGDEVRRRVPAYQKVAGGMIDSDDRDLTRRLLSEVRPSIRRHRTQVVRLGDETVVVADLGSDWQTVPVADRVLSDGEVEVRAEVTSLRVADTGTVELRGWAYLDNVDLAGSQPVLALSWRSDAGLVVDLPTSAGQSPEADIASDLLFADVTTSGFVALLDPALLSGSSGTWHLYATVGFDGLERTGRASVRPWTMAGIPARTDEAGRLSIVDHDDAGRIELVVRTPARPEVEVDPSGDRLRVRPPGAARAVVLEPGHGSGELSAPVDRRAGWAEIPFDRLAPGTRYVVHAVDAAGRRHDLVAPAGVEADPRLSPSRRGLLTVASRSRSAEVRSVVLAEETVTARLSLPPDVSGWETALVLGDTVVAGAVSGAVDGLGVDEVEARYPLGRTAWGHPDLPLPSGQYVVCVRSAEALEWVPMRPAACLCAILPVEQLQTRLRVRVEVFAPDDPGVRVVLAAPLADDERGQRLQRLLRETAAVDVAERDSVFFRAMFSEFASGNGLGVHEELRRRGSHLALLWSLADRSVPVPPGGTGVVEGSRAWHEAVARSRYHMVDVHQLEWFVRPREQVLIETMHGYPYKVMGHDWWEKMGNSVQEIGSLDRRTRDWSVLVSPAPYATPLLIEAFLTPAGADVRVLETGYPRNDALLRPDAVEARARARAVLGLRDDTVAVLYAPTFRDYLSPEDRTARTVSFFDAEQALALLPDHYVLLMRGHAFNARIRSDRVLSTPRVVDVTDHPDVHDLILASDVAVLDYSSLRFDYVLSGHPMVFLVPDLAEYDRARGGVIPYGPTAPGPQVSTTRETVAWLADLPRLDTEFAEARQRFRRDFVGLEDGRSGARLVDEVFVPRGDG